MNDLLRLALGLWVLTLPLYCTWLALRYHDGWGEFLAYVASRAYFVPWIIGVISLGVLTWLSEERR